MSFYRVAPYPSLVRPLFFTLFTSGLSSFTECKNNVSPVHKEPCVADVWSLRHQHVRYVPSFPFFLFTCRNRRSPVLSLARMTLPVADFQFCILGDPIDESQRIGAHGVWIRELPSLMGRNNRQRIRIPIPCYPRSLFLAPSCSSSRQVSAAGDLLRWPLVVIRVVLQIPVGAVLGHDCHNDGLPAALNLVLDEGDENE